MGVVGMNEALQDIRYAVRLLFRNPIFTAAAVLTLALGIGLNAAVFSVVHGMLFRPIPGVENEAELVQVYRQWPGNLRYGSNSIPHYQSIRDENSVFSDVAAFTIFPANLSTDGRSEMTLGMIVSANFFQALGASTVMGRAFLPEEAVGPGAHPVVVLSYGTWQGRFGGDPDILERSVNVNGHTYSIVGVAEEGFRGTRPVLEPAFWAPLMMQAELMPNASNRIEARGSNFLQAFARLAPGTSVEQARENMNALTARLREEFPGNYADSEILLVPQTEAGMAPQFRSAQVGLSTVVMVVVGLLLLIACVNVANLFFARARERRQEMGIRLSLGAGRGRIVRQLLTESLVFASIAGGLGIGLAYLAIEAANGIQLPSPFPIVFDFALDAPVLGFALAVTLLTGLVFGLAPALQASRSETVSALKGAAAGNRSRSYFSNGLVVAQVALSLLLLIGSGMFLQNLRSATQIEKGFESENLLIASVDPSLLGYDRGRSEVFYRTLTERVASLPGVLSVGLGQAVPLGFSSQQNGVTVPGYEPREGELMSIDYNIVDPGYFQAMGVELLTGRAFDEADDERGAPVIIVNQQMAERFWPGESALGKIVTTSGADREVIGVVENGKYRTLGEEPLRYMYFAQGQTFRPDMTIHVRTAGDPNALVGPLRSEILDLDPEMAMYGVQTMDAYLGLAMMPARVAGLTLGAFGLLGLILAAVGIYGVMAYSVAQRKREIGIRIALGANRGSVLGMVVGQGMALAGIGVAIGLAGALGASRLVASLLYTGEAITPTTFLGVPVALSLVALLATYLPARRAAGLDPMRVLRMD
jgi:putative ABC transport system permease protein